MAILGLRDTSGFVTDQRPKNWLEGVLLLEPNGDTPLTALSTLMKKRTVDDPEFNWWDKEMQDRRLQLNANITAAADNNTFTLAAATPSKAVKEGDMLWSAETGEIVRVATDPSLDTQVVVSRGWAGTTKTAIDFDGAGIDPNWYVIGSVYEEGSLAPSGISFDPTKRWNYTQIFRNSLEMTRTARKTRLRTGDQVAEAKRECLQLHTVDMERAFWFGERYETTINSKPARSTRGFVKTMESEASDRIVTADATNGADLEWLEEQTYNIFKFGSSEKMCFTGNRALLTIQQIVRKNSEAGFEISKPIKEFGMNVRRFVTPFGELVLKRHPLFNQMAGGVTTAVNYYGVESWLMVVDMQHCRIVTFDGAETSYQPNIQENGMDGMKSAYLTEKAIEWRLPKTHYLIKKLAKAKVDD